MHDHGDQPTEPHQTLCAARKRRRPRPAPTVASRRSRDICPTRQRLLDRDHEAFVEWFVSYWQRRGDELIAAAQSDEEAAR